MHSKGKSRAGQSPGKENPLKIPEILPKPPGSLENLENLENSRKSSGDPGSGVAGGIEISGISRIRQGSKKRFQNDFFETYKR